ncbi:hypothetical protein [Martelella alba]|uniref:Uncharacterized protein n=1 Tax=Martelella alba TaxID=2590451 RepID=A0ABY2SM51_9HYPH|nr:hypothetical protein [Martelella alba]TKI06342.1 hypothetical protein FCN80_10925 [Martelella alba]
MTYVDCYRFYFIRHSVDRYRSQNQMMPCRIPAVVRAPKIFMPGEILLSTRVIAIPPVPTRQNWCGSHSGQVKNTPYSRCLQTTRGMRMRHSKIDLHMVLLGAFSLIVLVALAFGS